MNSLYVLEVAKGVVTQWEIAPTAYLLPKRWNSQLYYHPDTQIFVGKSSTVSRHNYDSVSYAIMVALEDAHMSVAALRRERPQRSKKRKPPSKFIQLELLGMERESD